MGVGKKLSNYWKKNMEGNYKRISAGMGAMLITVVGALFYQLGIWALGGFINWGSFLDTSFGAVSGFLIMFLIIFFGSDGREILEDDKKEETSTEEAEEEYEE